MSINVAVGLGIPFLGTALGAACVFLLQGEMNATVRKTMLGFAAGVMVAASVWSLLIPAMDLSEGMGKLAFIPAAGDSFWVFYSCSFWIGWCPICIWIVKSRKGSKVTGKSQRC